MRLGLALCLVVGCGSGGTNAHQIDDPATAKRDELSHKRGLIEGREPESPYVLHDRTVYRTTDRCGQGPYRVEIDSPPAKFGEKLSVSVCSAKHNVVGNYRTTTTHVIEEPGDEPLIREASFGSGDPDNAACKASDVTVATSAASGGGGGATGHGKPVGGGATAAAPTTLQSKRLRAGGTADCVGDDIVDQSNWSSGASDPFTGHIAIDIWSDAPNDLEGFEVIVEHRVVRANMTDDAWTAYRDAYSKWLDELRANDDEQLRAGIATIIDTTVKTPPPPAPRAEVQPPRPSRNARWIAGYWLYADNEFHWISGLWDVPDEDIEKQLTVQAPTPPPTAPKRDEPTEAQPTATAVWTPGSWQWDGHAYIWVAGAWRIPPDERHAWQPAGWTIHAGTSVYVPGGWRVRMGR